MLTLFLYISYMKTAKLKIIDVFIDDLHHKIVSEILFQDLELYRSHLKLIYSAKRVYFNYNIIE